MMDRVWLLVLVLTLALPIACVHAAPSPLSPSEQMELRTLSGQISGPGRSAQTKREAAQLLLTKRYVQASEALAALLDRSDNRPARIAIAEAIASHHGQRDRAFIKPLMAMLTGEDAAVRAPAALALATYKDHGVTRQLIALVRDPKRDKAVRLVIITALQGMLDKQAVDTLVTLLDDSDAEIRQASTAALAKLTNIRAFGADAARWKEWWRENESKPRSVWLSDLADSLGRAKAALEVENAQLRSRLVEAMRDRYAAAPSATKDTLLLEFVRDALADVRLVGLGRLAARIAANESVPEELAAHVATMLDDPDARVRRSSAPLVAGLAGDKAIDLLLSRLETERGESVREGLLQALGQLRDPKALPMVLRAIQAKGEGVSAAAAMALHRIVMQQPLTEPQAGKAAQALAARYRRGDPQTHGAPLREALLTAMGSAGDPSVVGVLQDALKDPVATVRFAAVNGIARLGQADSAPSLVPLMTDGDRGVRQAAVVALGELGGAKYLQTILDRTLAAREADAAVRQQAWDVAMSILAKAEPDAIWSVSEALAKRTDALEQRIRVGQVLVDALQAGSDARLPAARRRLAACLVSASRAAEAAAQLGLAHAEMARAKDVAAPAVWLEWIDALLAAADPTVVKVVAGGADEPFAQACGRIEAALKDMLAKGKHAPAVLIGGQVIAELGPRLGPERKAAITALLADATARRIQADRTRVEALVRHLAGKDVQAALAAQAELKTMGARAVRPLIEELSKALVADGSDTSAEAPILATLTQIAPKLNGYDPAADKAERLKTIDRWLAALGGPSPGGADGPR